MSSLSFFILLGVMALLGPLFLLLLRNFRKVEKTYESALEINQKRLDQQTSRVNILIKALSNLQARLSEYPVVESWKTFFLDEARALIKADKASYWRWLEKDQKFAVDSVRGRGLNQGANDNDYGDVDPIFYEVVKRRVVLLNPRGKRKQPDDVLIVPLVVEGVDMGVFEFVRRGEEPLNQRDADLIAMFVKQLALYLENRNLVLNREKFYLELLQTLADTLDLKDAIAGGETKHIRLLAREMGKKMNLPDEFLNYLEFAALMHDIGKIAIDDQILRKPGKLTPEEFEIIKRHPELGYNILSPVSLLAPVAPMVLYHQEWFNGKGYPEGLSGEEIPLGARIVAVLDAWGAMVTSRSWRKALSKEAAIDEIRRGAGTQFDPKVVDAFLAVVEDKRVIA